MQSSTQQNRATAKKSRVSFNPCVQVTEIPSRRQILDLNTDAYTKSIPANFVPVDDFESLIRAHDVNGSPKWITDRIRNLHEAHGEQKPKEYPVAQKVRDGPPIATLKPLSMYYKRGERPPLEVLVAYMETHNYKKWAIERTIKNYNDTTQQMSMENLCKTMGSIFNNTSKSSTYKPKRKTLRQRFSK